MIYLPNKSFRKGLVFLIGFCVFFSSLVPETWAFSFHVDSKEITLTSTEVRIEDSASKNIQKSILSQPEDESGFHIVDEKMDVKDLGGGKYTAKLYQEPRPLEKDKSGVLRLQEVGSQKFAEGKSILQSSKEGYLYNVPIGKDSIKIQAGVLQTNKGIQKVQTSDYLKESKENQTIYTYKNLYPGIDVRFTDKGDSRWREILINQKPKNLENDDALIFWEDYQLPKGVKVLGGDGKEINGEKEMSRETLTLLTSDNKTLTVSDAFVFDAAKDSLKLPISQVVKVKKGHLSIGLKLEASYLNAPDRQYPVTIDPQYNYCSSTDATNCNSTTSLTTISLDPSVYYPSGYEFSSLDSDYIALGTSDNGSSYSSLVKFDVNWNNIPSGSTIDSAYLHMTMFQSIPANSSLNTRADQLNQPWTFSSSTRYSDVISGAVAQGTRTVTGNNGAGDIEYTWAVTNAVRNWFSGTTNNGFSIHPNVSPDWYPYDANHNWVRSTWPFNNSHSFYGSTFPTTSKRPYLEVNYTYTPPPVPNLTYGTFSVNQSSPLFQGQTITGTLGVLNTGNARASAGVVDFYFAQNVNGNISDRVGSANYSAIDGGSSVSVPFSFQIPTGFQNGTNYRFLWKIDANDTTSNESNERDNNAFESTTYTVQARPNLHPTGLTTSYWTGPSGNMVLEQYCINLPFSATISFENNSSLASASNVEYSIRLHSTTGGGYYELSNLSPANLGNISTNSSRSVNVEATIPNIVPPGTYSVEVLLNPNGSIPEMNDTFADNNFVGSNVSVPASNADFRFTNFSVTPSSPNAGSDITVSGTAKNAGCSYGTFPLTKFYFKNGSSVSSGDYVDQYKIRDDYFMQDVFAGESRNFSFTYTVPPASSGNYVVYAWVDAAGSYTELNENNNRTSSNISVSANNIDFQVVSATDQTSGRRYPGTQLTLNGEFRNNSSTAANNIDVRMRLKDTSTGAFYAMSATSPATVNLAANTQRTFTLTGNIPNNIPLYRDYQVEVTLDAPGYFSDPNRSNNVGLSGSMYVEPQSYGNPGGGGTSPDGSQPCTVRNLRDSDCDGIPDNEEKTGGTPPSSSQQTISLVGNQNNHVASWSDLLMGVHLADPVNSRTGALEFTQTDFELPGRGIPINFERTYNSKINDLNNRLGYGWNFSYNTYYYKDPSNLSVTVNFGNRISALFTTNNGGATYQAPDGVFDTLVVDGSSFIYRTIDGIQYKFSPISNGVVTDPNMGILNQIVDTNGNTTQLNYTLTNGIPLLTSVVDASGRTISFTYGDANNSQTWDKIVKLEESVNPQVSERRVVNYSYNENGDLILVQSNRAYNGTIEWIEKSFTYDSSHRMLTYTDPRGTILTNEYDASGKVVRQKETKPGGNIRTIYELNYAASVPAGSGASVCTELKNYRDANNYYTSKDCFDNKGLLSYRTDGEGNATRFEYDPVYGLVTRITDPNGNVTTYTYDDKRRKIRETLPNLGDLRTVTAYGYEDIFNRVTSKNEAVTDVMTGQQMGLKRTTFDIDTSTGNVTGIHDPLNNTEFFSYNNEGNLISHTDKNGNIVSYTYTGDGNYKASESITVHKPDNSSSNVSKQYTYDSYGNVKSYTDPRGKITRYAYDTNGNLRLLTDALSNTVSYTYDAEGNKISMTDQEGGTTEWTYDTDISSTPTNVLSETKVYPLDPAKNIVTRYEYDYSGNRTKIIDPLGRQTTFTYNAANRVSQKITPVDTITYTYDANGNEIREVNSLNEKTEFDYNSRNKNTVTRKYSDSTQFVSYENVYDGFSRLVQVIDGKNHPTAYTYDLNDHILTITDRDSNVTTYTYDANGNRLSVLNPNALANNSLRNSNGHSTTYEYDEINRLVRETNALNFQTLTFYDQNSNVVSVIDRQNSDGGNNTHVNQFIYDDLNRKTTEKDSYNEETSYTYDKLANVLTKTDRNGNTTNYDYDPFYQLISVQDSLGAVTTYTFDKAGNKKSVTYPNNTTTNYTYDNGDRLITIVDALNGDIHYSYDAVGNKLTSKDKNSNQTTFTYDKLNRLSSETNAKNVTTTYSYDANGNLLSETTGGKGRVWTYDNMDRVIALSDYGKQVERYTYDAHGNVLTKTDGNNALVRYSYDSLDRVGTKVLSSGDINYTYDNWENLLSINEGGLVTLSTAYDYENRPTTEIRTYPGMTSRQFTLRRTYKPDGQISTITDAANRTVSYNYDNLNLLDTVVFDGGTIANYDYTPMGKPSRLVYSNGVDTAYNYDSLNRLATEETKNSTGNVLFKHEYSYDAESNRTRLIEDNNRTINYSYDELNQLQSVDYSNIAGNSDMQFSYDNWGNRSMYTSVTDAVNYTYSSTSNELQSLSYAGNLNTTFTYDGNGSLVSENINRLAKPIKNVSYTYDEQRRLTGISYSTSSTVNFLPSAGVSSVSYVYSDDGNRIGKNVNEKVSYVFNNGLNVINEINETGDVTKSIIRGLDQIAEIDATGNFQFVTTDVLGSAVLITDASENVVGKYEYDPFGSIIGKDGAANTSYLFTGQEFDPESELTYMNARYYNSTLGRFLSRDPVLGMNGSLVSKNGYVYVNNNPLKYVDPTGEKIEMPNTFPDSTRHHFNKDEIPAYLVRLENRFFGLGAIGSEIGMVAEDTFDSITTSAAGILVIGTGNVDMAAIYLLAGASKVDSVVTNLANIFNNASNFWYGRPPEHLVKESMIRSSIRDIVGDTELMDRAEEAVDLSQLIVGGIEKIGKLKTYLQYDKVNTNAKSLGLDYITQGPLNKKGKETVNELLEYTTESGKEAVKAHTGKSLFGLFEEAFLPNSY